MVSLKESETEKEKHRAQQATERDTSLAIFNAKCRLSSMQHPRDPNAKSSMIMPIMENKLDASLTAQN